jgi:hypothetical protein
MAHAQCVWTDSAPLAAVITLGSILHSGGPGRLFSYPVFSGERAGVFTAHGRIPNAVLHLGSVLRYSQKRTYLLILPMDVVQAN